MSLSLGVGPLISGVSHPSGKAEYPPPYSVGTAMGEHLRVESLFRITEHRLFYLANNTGPKWNRRKCWSCGNIWSPTQAQSCSYCQKPLRDLRLLMATRWEPHWYKGFEELINQRLRHLSLVTPAVLFYRDGRMISVYHYNGEHLLADVSAPMAPDRLVVSTHSICRVLLFLHQKGAIIPHFGAENVLVMPDDTVRVFDLDITDMLTDEATLWRHSPDLPSKNVRDLARTMQRLCPPEHQELMLLLEQGRLGHFDGIRPFGKALSDLYNSGRATPVATWAAAHTDQGLVRKHNEDDWGWRILGGDVRLYAVADGMGGHDDGEVASQLAIDTLTQKLAGAKGSIDVLGKELEKAFFAANQAVTARNKAEHKQMGTTLVAAIVEGKNAVIANAGDSRAYLFRRGKLEQLSRDHTIAQELIDAGKLKPEDAGNHPRGNVLTSNLGGEDEDLDVAVKKITLEAGDRLLLCSDGLWGAASDAAITQILALYAEKSEAVRELLRTAYDAGAPDNVTAVLMDV